MGMTGGWVIRNPKLEREFMVLSMVNEFMEISPFGGIYNGQNYKI
jgi:hypothetical protein